MRERSNSGSRVPSHLYTSGIVEDTCPCWTTSDGQRFYTKEDAEAHQRTIAMRALVEEHGYSGMSKEDVADFIVEHADEVKKILG